MSIWANETHDCPNIVVCVEIERLQWPLASNHWDLVPFGRKCESKKPNNDWKWNEREKESQFGDLSVFDF